MTKKQKQKKAKLLRHSKTRQSSAPPTSQVSLEKISSVSTDTQVLNVSVYENNIGEI